MDELTGAFTDADTVCLLDIYPANEKPIEGITSEALAHRISRAGKRDVAYAPSFAEAVGSVAGLAQPGDMILTLGAGSVSQLGPTLLEKLDLGGFRTAQRR